MIENEGIDMRIKMTIIPGIDMTDIIEILDMIGTEVPGAGTIDLAGAVIEMTKETTDLIEGMMIETEMNDTTGATIEEGIVVVAGNKIMVEITETTGMHLTLQGPFHLIKLF